MDALHPAPLNPSHTSVATDSSAETPLAVVDTRQRIVELNSAARAVGLERGMLNTAALAVYPSLRCLSQDYRAEQQALHSIASWAIQFSPHVSLAPPCEVLLEVGGSLKLFHSLAGFQQSLQHAISQLNFHIQTGLAPTPRGAQAFARSRDPVAALSLADLHLRLQNLPINTMAWPEKISKKIAAVGVKTLAECEALPRAGFVKRYGREVRQQLDQLWGHCEDPREVFSPDARFSRSLDLLSETENLNYLLPGFERLFHTLCIQLQGMGCGLLCLHISLAHGRESPTRFDLQLQQTSREPAHWMALLQHRFARLQLPAAVRAIQVRAGHFIELAHRQTALWAQADVGKQSALIEQLAARLGAEALHSVSTYASHCPDKAWQRVAAGQGCELIKETRPRPLWLLLQAIPISPQRLRNFTPAERLETAWWDSNCQRDYYRAGTVDGQQVWVYREHAAPDQWYLHGLFG